jgi:hypothetical protein
VAYGVFADRPTAQQRRMLDAIDQGSVFAWSRHITGQDTTTLTTWDEFESVAVIPGTSTRANGDTRLDDEVWVVVKRTVDGNDIRFVEQFQPMDWGDDPDYCWFVDCSGGASHSSGTAEVNTPSTYDYGYISDNGYIWRIALGDVELYNGLDAGGSASNLGGGQVSLPFAGNPFVAGDAVVISGTTNYNNTYTLQTGTSTTALVITSGYYAETFDGTEPVTGLFGTGISGAGRMVQAADGTLYMGHNWDGTTCVTKYDTDLNATTDFLTWPVIDVLNTTVGLALNDDDTALYVWTKAASGKGYLFKFALPAGTSDWYRNLTSPGYDTDVDASGNAYGAESKQHYKYAVADGTRTELTDVNTPYPTLVSGGYGWNTIVDDDMGLVVAAGGMTTLTAYGPPTTTSLYNLAVRTLANSKGDQVAIGGTYTSGSLTYSYNIDSGQIVTDGDYIYVLLEDASPPTLYKYQWTGTSLSEVTSAAAPTYAIGLFFDTFDNLVVVNQDNSTKQTTVFYYYDTDLNSLGSVGNLPNTTLAGWDGLLGAAWIQGNYFANGEDARFAYGVDVNEVNVPHLPNMEVCVYADGKPLADTYTATADANGTYTIDIADAYDVVIAGLNYYSILETMPLVDTETLGTQETIQQISIDFYESMGAHVGREMDYSADWLFSDDSFATAIDPFTGYKGPAPFLRGTHRDPVIYVYEWDPVPLTIRSMTTDMEATLEQ